MDSKAKNDELDTVLSYIKANNESSRSFMY